MNSDYYRVLGIDPIASNVDVKIAYRKMVLQCHPDRNPHPHAANWFMDVQAAYECLTDPVRRAEHDVRRQDGRAAASGNVYDAPQSASNGTEHGERGGDIHVSVRIHASLERHVREVELERLNLCAECGGLGYDVSVSYTAECLGCQGRRVVRRAHRASVTIPKDVCDGAILVLRNEGHTGKHGGARGDVYVTVHVDHVAASHTARSGADAGRDRDIIFLNFSLSHNQVHDGKLSLRIRMRLRNDRPANNQVIVSAFIQRADGTPIPDANGLYADESSNVCVSELVPLGAARFVEWELFIPNDEMHIDEQTDCSVVAVAFRPSDGGQLKQIGVSRRAYFKRKAGRPSQLGPEWFRHTCPVVSLIIIAMTVARYTSVAGFGFGLLLWIVAHLFFSTVCGCVSTSSVAMKVASCLVPATGLAASFIYPDSFWGGWWLHFLIAPVLWFTCCGIGAPAEGGQTEAVADLTNSPDDDGVGVR